MEWGNLRKKNNHASRRDLNPEPPRMTTRLRRLAFIPIIQTWRPRETFKVEVTLNVGFWNPVLCAARKVCYANFCAKCWTRNWWLAKSKSTVKLMDHWDQKYDAKWRKIINIPSNSARNLFLLKITKIAKVRRFEVTWGKSIVWMSSSRNDGKK
jgi:hypothetical protein